MYHLCTTATYPAIYHKRKILDIRLNIKDFSSVGVTGFEPATTRPPDAYSNRAELHPVAFRSANIVYFSQIVTFLQDFFLILENFCLCLIQRTLGELPNFGVMIWQLYYMLRSALICFQVTRFRNKGNHFI